MSAASVPTLSKIWQSAIVQQIKDSIADTDRNATFAIGGSVTMEHQLEGAESAAAGFAPDESEEKNSEAKDVEVPTCPPIQIRFDGNRKLVLPTLNDSEEL